MNNNSMIKRIWAAALAGIIVFLISWTGILSGIDHFITDSLYHRPRGLDNRIKIIAIDEKSLSELGPYNTWGRDIHGRLLDSLYADPEASPSIVGFDMIFQGGTDEDADMRLVRASEGRDVVFASNIVFRDRVEKDESGKSYLNRLNVEMVEYPYLMGTQDIKTGFANTIQDPADNSVRAFFPYLNTGEGDMPSLAMTMALALQEKDELRINVSNAEAGKSLLLRYAGSPGDYEHISYVDVLEGRIPPQALKDCILLVGAYAPGMMDAYGVPTGHGSQMYGVEIHANIIQALEDGAYMNPIPKPGYSLAYAIITALFILIAGTVPVWMAALLAALVVAVQCFGGAMLLDSHLFLPIMPLPLAVILSVVGVLGQKYLLSLLHRRKVMKAFRQYVAPQIVEEISKANDFKLTLGGQRRDVAVLFVDIRGFTPLSESLEPEQVVEVLNEYLSLTTKSIFDNLGTLDKFVGDATMAVFNSPFDLEDYIFRAVCAARDIVEGSEDIRRKAFEMTGKTVGFGVGVNCGPAIVGNIGCEFRMDFTAIGDTVNTAARLEANAKAGQVLLSQMVIDALGDRIVTRPVGEIPLKGKSIPLMVYELVEVRG